MDRVVNGRRSPHLRTALKAVGHAHALGVDGRAKARAEIRAAERVIEAARAFYDAPCGTSPTVEGTPCGDLALAIGDALRALDERNAT